MHCGASVSELYHVFIGSMVVMYILHVCNVYMHNAQYDICTNLCIGGLGRAERLALSLSASLIFPAFARLFLPHIGLSYRSRVHSSLYSLSCDDFSTLLEVFRI